MRRGFSDGDAQGAAARLVLCLARVARHCFSGAGRSCVEKYFVKVSALDPTIFSPSRTAHARGSGVLFRSRAAPRASILWRRFVMNNPRNQSMLDDLRLRFDSSQNRALPLSPYSRSRSALARTPRSQRGQRSVVATAAA
jgi:hypothetical protein